MVQVTLHNGVGNLSRGHIKWTFHILGQWVCTNPVANRLYKSKDAEKYQCGSVKPFGKKNGSLAVEVHRTKCLCDL